LAGEVAGRCDHMQLREVQVGHHPFDVLGGAIAEQFVTDHGGAVVGAGGLTILAQAPGTAGWLPSR
jgi:hypothetical protein